MRLSIEPVFFFIVLIHYTYSELPSSVISRHSSAVKSLFVGEEPVVFTLNGEDESVWMIETESDRILFLSFSSENGIGDNNVANHLKNYLTIYDGSDQEKSQHLDRFYSTGNTVFLHFHRSDGTFVQSSSKLKLKIQKAVDCPINLGGQSSCGRIVDDVSCYCATFNTRTWADTRAYCNNNRMTFFRVDNYEEDLAIHRTWAGPQELWIGASDVYQEGNFTWDNGDIPIDSGYTNWLPGQPDNVINQDCVEYPKSTAFAWSDVTCGKENGGICESQP